MKDEHPPPPEVCRNNIMTPILQSFALPCGSPILRSERVKRVRRESKSERIVLILNSADTFSSSFFIAVDLFDVWKTFHKSDYMLPIELFLRATNANSPVGAISRQNDLLEETPTELEAIVIYPLVPPN